MSLHCVVPGCSSNAESTHSFYPFPRDLIKRARWVLAVRRPVGSLGSCAMVCDRHFEERFLVKRGGRMQLVGNAVPTLYMPEQTTLTKPFPDDTASEEALSDREAENHLEDQRLGPKLLPAVRSAGYMKLATPFLVELPKYSPPRGTAWRPNEAVTKQELVACRACLVAEGRLYAISGSGLEDTLAALTGIEMPVEVGFPCHLCAFCMARLSKCAAFRDSCQRSTALLRTLLEEGALTLDNIKTIDRKKHRLTHGLTQVDLYDLKNYKVLDIAPLIENHNDNLQQVSEYTEIELLENDDVAACLDTHDLEQQIDIFDDIKVELINENNDANSDVDDVKYTPEIYSCDVLEQFTREKERKTVKLDKEIAKHEVNSEKLPIKRRKEVKIENLLVKMNRGEYLFRKSLDVVSKELNCAIKILSKEEQRQEVEERKRNSKSAYCCDLCGHGFQTENTMRKHLARSHDPRFRRDHHCQEECTASNLANHPLECDACRFRFRSRMKLNKHRQKHRTTYTCNECGYLSRTSTYAKTHSLMHKGKTYKCPHCPVEYNHLTSYYNHIRMRHPGAYEACDECGETFAAGRGLRMHKALAHNQTDKPDATLKCAECDVTFLDAEALRKHAELSAGVPHAALWPCAACGDSCGSEPALKEHAAKHQAERRHCDDCNKTFLTAGSFAVHVHRKHLNRRATGAEIRPQREWGRGGPCVCEICGKICKNSALLQYHMNGHLPVKPFPCQQCSKAFTTRGALKAHMRVHTGERPFQCEQCSLAVTSKSNLIRHIQHLHLNQRKLVNCAICGKQLSAGALPLHIRSVHQNQKYVRRKRTRTRPAAEP